MSIQVAKVRNFTGHSQAVYTLCAGNENENFYSAGADGMVVKWQLDQPDGELIMRFPFAIYCLLQFDDLLFCGGSKGELTIFNLKTKSIVRQIYLDTNAIFDIVFWNNQLIVGNKIGQLIILNLDWEIELQFKLSTNSIRKMIPTIDNLFVTGSEGMIWSLSKSFEVLVAVKGHDQSIFAMAYQDHTKTLFTGGRDATLKIWNDFELSNTINAHWFHINFIALDPSQNYYATCSLDKSIKIWNAENNALLKVISNEKYEAHQSSVNKILWIGINRFISCSDDRMIMCFEIQQK
jgi:WD repeat-containing protein 61